MADVEVVMNLTGCNEIRNDPAVQSALLSRANAIAAAAKGMDVDCETVVKPGGRRAHARVRTSGYMAAKRNAKYNVLLKSMDAGR